jgi:hypothetical protein
MPALIRVTATAMWQLQRHLLFDPRWNNGSYLTIVGPCIDPDAKNVITLGVEFIEQIRHAEKAVEVTFPDGTTLAPFPK